jgi:excinuclease ABC subunit A
LHDQIRGLEYVNKVISVDQAPIGSTPASNPATYSGLFDLVRALFARVPEARSRGFSPGRFSFNVPGGRCEACQGAGKKRIEMHFLPDVWVECDVCAGKRFTADTLAVRYRGNSIADVLDMTVDQALELFASIPRIRRILQTLADVGLGYLLLGQAATTLSGGESQRVKLAAELARPDTGSTLYILDEPTTGLHAHDVNKLLDVFHRLVDLGNTVIVVEHQLDVIAAADWILDLGPEAGAHGGTLVVAGTPETVAKHPASHTGKALAPLLKKAAKTHREPFNPRAVLEAQLALDHAARQAARQQAHSAPPDIPPWEKDGPAWHLQLRVTRSGKPIRWDAQILASIIAKLESTQLFPPTNWANRSVVRIPAPDSGPPVLEALTSNEWILTLTFRARLRYHQDQLVDLLCLPPWQDAIPSDAHQVDVGPPSSAGQFITIRLHHLDEILTPGFQTFLDAVVQSWRKPITRSQTKKRKR